MPQFRRCILQSHYPYTPGLNNPILLIRDGRDVMVSAYYHFLFENDTNSADLVKHWNKQLKFKDIRDIETNLYAFIEYFYANFRVAGRPLDWPSHIRSYLGRKNVLLVRYEDALKQPDQALKRILVHIDVHKTDDELISQSVRKYSFSNIARRERGDERVDSFFRKGVAGDWKNKFDRRTKNLFNDLAGDMLIKLGYEKDPNWHDK